MNHDDLNAAFEEFLEVRGEYLIEPMREEGILPQYPENHVLRDHREKYPDDPIHADLYTGDIWGPPEIDESIGRILDQDCFVMDPPPYWCTFGPFGEEREEKLERTAEILDNYFGELESRGLILIQDMISAPQDPLPV